MIDIKSKTCEFDSCKTRASFNIPGSLPKFCAKHKTKDMIKNPRTKCIVKDCQELAIYGLFFQIHCEDHKEEKEYNLVERTCLKCGNVDILNKEGICVTICSFVEADKIIKKHQKKKELYIEKLLLKTFEIPFYKRDEIIDKNCSSCRPDFVYHLGKYILIIEVDEQQHRSYQSCKGVDDKLARKITEDIRMYNIFQSFEGLPVIFLRYNPDSFKDKENKICKISDKKREEIFLKWVKKCLDLKDNLQACYVKYLFYDNFLESDVEFEKIDEKKLI